jgi:hypothetical protein
MHVFLLSLAQGRIELAMLRIGYIGRRHGAGLEDVF